MKFFYSKVLVIFLFLGCRPSDTSAVTYNKMSDGYFTSVHVLTVNPQEHLIVPVKASEEAGKETVATLAHRNQAIAAINGGFYKKNGSPAGALKIHNQWHSIPTHPKGAVGRGAVGWSDENHQVIFDRILTHNSLQESLANNQIEVIPMSTPPYTTSKMWGALPHIVGGTPVLVRNGHLIEDFEAEQTLKSFLNNKHARTAVGIKENGNWVFVVVDGSFKGLFGGMTIRELAKFMLDLGCIEALNLCGGRSSTMVVEGKVINDPYGKIAEDGKNVNAVSDAILIF